MTIHQGQGRSAGSRRSATTIHALTAILVLSMVLGGCSWFRKRPPPPAAAPEPVATAPVLEPALPSSATATYCPGYREVFAAAVFPRDAVIRGIAQGRAVVRFHVDGDAVSIVSVTSSDPAFGEAAAQIVLGYRCHADRPTDIEQSFNFARNR